MSDSCASSHSKLRQYRCSTCHKSFKSQSHLRRHDSSHRKDAQHQCNFCSKSFVRQDALRRHFKTCSKVEGVVPASQRGRRPRACQNCRTRKLQCDRAHPCLRCSSVQAECSYTTVLEEKISDANIPIKFLLNYTNPYLDSVSDAFALSGAHAESAVEHAQKFRRSASYLHEDGMADLFSDIFPNFYQDPDVPVDPPPASITILSTPSIQRRVDALITLLMKQHELNNNASAFSERPFPLDVAKSIFTGSSIAEYVSAFFSYFHPHEPFIHQPSFDMETISSHLLLSVSLIGSLFSTPRDDLLSARPFFDLAEDHVFGLLRGVIEHSSDPKISIEVVQSAVLIHGLQMNSNDEAVRRRIRISRFPEIVASVRVLGLAETIRTPLSNGLDWEQFIAEEIRIRLATRVFATDCLSTLLFKSPSQIMISEMSGDLPITDPIFEASTAAEFMDLVTTSINREPQLRSLKNIVSLLLDNDWAEPKTMGLSHIGLQHLPTVMFALHSVIYMSRSGLLLPSTLDTLYRATDRWKDLWNFVSSNRAERNIRLVGFTKYGLELCWLAQKILEVSRRGDLQSPYMGSVPTYSLNDLHEFIQRYAREQ